MHWYGHLYMGQKAKKRRFSIIQNIRRNRLQPGVHVLTLPSDVKNVLDIYPASVLLENYYKNREDLLILGIAADYYEALEVAREIVADVYRETGGFSAAAFLNMNGQR